jgi:hypothetical protein
MRLPENVRPPMSTLSMIVACTFSGASMRRPAKRRYSSPATSADAPPPKPFSSATICGMAVILTVRAMVKPMVAPITMPARIQVKLTISQCSSVAADGDEHARRAEHVAGARRRGELSRFRPRMKRPPPRGRRSG